jgi:hypothetical protein
VLEICIGREDRRFSDYRKKVSTRESAKKMFDKTNKRCIIKVYLNQGGSRAWAKEGIST